MTIKIYSDIADERERQDKKWGGKEHDRLHTPGDWAGLIEDRTHEITDSHLNVTETRKMFVQIAALAVAAIEVVDEN